MLFQSLLIFIEKCAIIILSEKNVTMDFYCSCDISGSRRRADCLERRVEELERGV